jgi:hypothetical protein
MERQASKLPQMESWVEHPVSGVKAPLGVIITNLNDHTKWSRDQIADWLDMIHDNEELDLSFKHEGESI